MSFMPTDTPEFEEVRQQHDAWMESSRLELLAETETVDGRRTPPLSSNEATFGQPQNVASAQS